MENERKREVLRKSRTVRYMNYMENIVLTFENKTSCCLRYNQIKHPKELKIGILRTRLLIESHITYYKGQRHDKR